MTECVLVVEDNEALAENVAEMIRDEGAEVSICRDAESAERWAAGSGFDLAIVDIRLAGGGDGLELVPRLRRLSPHGEIVLMTGHVTVDSALQAIQRGVYAYLVKPFEPEHLITMVKSALAQVALRRDKQALSLRLSASEALYRGVVEAVEAFILGLDAGGTIRFCNRFAAERSGYAAADLAGRSFFDLCGLSPDSALAQRLLAGHAVRDHECQLAPRKGAPRTVRWTITQLDTMSLPAAMRASQALASEHGSVQLAVGIDITERLLLEKRSAEAEALAAMGTLTTALAHEIRNPLNAAKLQLELVVRRARRMGPEVFQQQIAEPTQLVRTEIDRLASLLDEFLDLARPRLIERFEVPLAPLFQDVLDLQAPLIEAAKVRVVQSVRPADLSVLGDADKLKQVLINVVANAIEALRDRQGGGQVELSAARDAQGFVCVRVIDNGPGVATSVADQVFTPFVTTKRGGTGLGLSIVRKIIQQHGGEIELRSDQASGTEVRFRLP